MIELRRIDPLRSMRQFYLTMLFVPNLY